MAPSLANATQALQDLLDVTASTPPPDVKRLMSRLPSPHQVTDPALSQALEVLGILAAEVVRQNVLIGALTELIRVMNAPPTPSTPAPTPTPLVATSATSNEPPNPKRKR